MINPSKMSQNPYQAFGSPMLGSTITTAPRRQGDGMDSESLRQSKSPSGGHSSKYPGVEALAKDPLKTGKLLDSPVSGKRIDVGNLSDDKVLFHPVTPSICGNNAGVRKEAELVLPPSRVIERDAVEGDVTMTSTICTSQETRHLSVQVEQLQTQLNNQTKVNTDLKKLLVASMGDDLHYKVDSLIRTRAQLADEIGGYTEKIVQDHETLDKLSIQADMWRSKYTASRVFIDQLAGGKELYEHLYTDSKQALTQLLQERTQMADSLKETYRYLKVIKDSFDPRGAARTPPTIPNILELARTNHLLADSIKFRLLPALPIFPAALDGCIQNGSTPGEKLALQTLVTEISPDKITTSTIPNRLPAKLLGTFDRFHPHVRYDNITFNCCAQCSGEIHVV